MRSAKAGARRVADSPGATSRFTVSSREAGALSLTMRWRRVSWPHASLENR